MTATIGDLHVAIRTEALEATLARLDSEWFEAGEDDPDLTAERAARDTTNAVGFTLYCLVDWLSLNQLQSEGEQRAALLADLARDADVLFPHFLGEPAVDLLREDLGDAIAAKMAGELEELGPRRPVAVARTARTLLDALGGPDGRRTNADADYRAKLVAHLLAGAPETLREVLPELDKQWASGGKEPLDAEFFVFSDTALVTRPPVGHPGSRNARKKSKRPKRPKQHGRRKR